MKTIRSLMILAGLSMAVLALSATGAKAQGLTMTNIGGKFTLPLEAVWGHATLPAGEYTLRYGYAPSGLPVVEVLGTAKGSRHAFILAQAADTASGARNAIVCVRDGGILIVRALEMPVVGQTASFAMPHGAQLMAHVQSDNTNTLLAGGPMLIQRVPITGSSK